MKLITNGKSIATLELHREADVSVDGLTLKVVPKGLERPKELRIQVQGDTPKGTPDEKAE